MTHGVPETIGAKLRELLAKHDVSQRELAAKLAGPRATPKQRENKRRQIVDWANDHKRPGPTNARALARALDVAPDYFVSVTTSPPVGQQQLVDAAQALVEVGTAIAAALERLGGLLQRQEAVVAHLESALERLERLTASNGDV